MSKAENSMNNSQHTEKSSYDLLVQQNEVLKKLNQFSLELSKLPSESNLESFIAKHAKEITGAAVAVFAKYNPISRTSSVQHIELEAGLLKNVVGLLGKQITEIQMVVSDETYREMTINIFGYRETLHDASFGEISRPVGAAIEKLLNVDRFIGIAYLLDSRLYGTSLLAMRKGHPNPSNDILENFIHLATVSLQRKRVEEALCKNKEWLDETTRIAKVGGWTIDLTGNTLEWTEETFRIHELPYGAPPNVTEAIEFYHPDDRPRVAAAVQRAIESGVDFDFEARTITAKKNIIWVRAIGHAISSANRLVGVRGVVQDITERKRAEAKLADSHQRLDFALQGGQLGIWDWNIQTGAVVYSDLWAKMLEYSPDEVEPTVDFFKKHVHPEDLAAVLERLTGHIEGSLPVYDSEHRLQTKSGRWLWIHDRGKVVKRDKDGDPVRVSGVIRDITDRKHAEHALRESEVFARSTLDGLSAHIAIIDESGVIIAVNKAWREFAVKNPPVTGNVLEGANYLQICDGAASESPEAAEFAKAIRSVLSGSEEEIAIEYACHSLDEQRWFIGRVTQFPAGGTRRVIVAHENITERKLAEAKIREKDLMFRKLSANVPDLIYQFTRKPDGSYCVPIASDGIKNIFGCSPEDVLDDFTPIERVIYPEDAERVLSDIEYSAKHLTYFTCEFRVQIPGKEIQWIFSRSAPEKLEDGSITWFGFNADITERKQAEKAIAAEKERLSVTLRSIGDGVITTDTLGNVVIMNKVAEELTGWKLEEAQGKPLSSVFDIINQSTREPHENPVKKVLSTGAIIELANHTLLISRDGTERIIADSGAPIKDKESKTIGVVLVFRDITEKHKLLDNMQRIDKLDALGVLAGGIAHDFNNLLGGIFGYIDMAKEISTEEEVSQRLSKAMNTIDRAQSLTSQLLTFAKGGAPVQKIDNLFPFIEETAKFALSGSNVSCLFDIPKDLWACNFDKNQIGQVIDNLIINAQQAMPVGGTIELSARNIVLEENEHPLLGKNNYVRISVKDSGIGISQKLLPKIFDPFFTTKAKGHGLGLATCYSIIKRHDGCIDVDSEPGNGSTFHIYLPAASESTTTIPKKPEKKHKGSGTILVMDDEEVMRETISDMLKMLGYTVVCKKDGREAVEYFLGESKAKRTFSGMIFDLTVPGGIGGKAAIEEIRKTNPDIPAFVASGYADDPVMKNPIEYGFTASICKPFRKSELSDRKSELSEMLNKYLKQKK